MKSTKGFTLIELLVVIAIIGILSSVVLASLNSARSKGADAAIKSNLANIRAQAELYYDGAGAGTYGTAFTFAAASATCHTSGTGVLSDTTVRSAIAAAVSAGGTNASCVNTGTAWGVAVPLKSSASMFSCVDSTGNATTTATANGGLAAGDAACN